MDLGSVLGFVLGVIVIFVTMLLGADFNIGEMKQFFDATSVMATFGGTFCATLIAVPLGRLVGALKAMKIVFQPPKTNPTLIISQIIQLSNLARKEGLLELEETARGMNDPFLLKGVMLIADGATPELVQTVLETEVSYIETRHKGVAGVYEFMAASGPAWGMIGTLIGLILMLGSLSDPSSLGPQMAVAIITTFYGSIYANFICNPVANKLKMYSNEEMLVKEIQIEGMLSILNGENPRNIEEKLKAFISPGIRNATADGGEKGAGREEE